MIDGPPILWCAGSIQIIGASMGWSLPSMSIQVRFLDGSYAYTTLPDLDRDKISIGEIRSLVRSSFPQTIDESDASIVS